MPERNLGPVSQINGVVFPPELAALTSPENWHVIKTRLLSAHVRATGTCCSCCCYESAIGKELRK
jgi:hypothetical protein